MKKKVNSEKGKGMKFPFVSSPSFRIGKNEEFGFESESRFCADSARARIL